jgi:hypothetical protein
VSLSVVNGFLCFSSCDAAKALQGKNPHPKPHTPHASRTDQPAVLYGGNLNQSGSGSNAVPPASQTSQADLSDQYAPVDVTA